MKKLLLILLLFPLLAFPQSEKRYRSIIIDSVKALNGGVLDVKDIIKLDTTLRVSDGEQIEFLSGVSTGILKLGGVLGGDVTWSLPGVTGAFTLGTGTANKITSWSATNTIQSGAWEFSGGGSLFPSTDGFNIGISGTNRVGTMFMDGSAELDFATTLIFDEAGSERMRILTGGNVGIGTVAPATRLSVNTSDANSVAIVTLENTAGDFQIFHTNATPEFAITGSIGDLAVDGTAGNLYLKQSGTATNTGWGIIGGANDPIYKSYSLSNPGTAGIFYVAGHYGFAAADANLTIGGTVIQTFGTAGQAHGSHAFCVASGAGGTDLVLTVTGVSMTDEGVRNDADSEIIVADADAASTNEYFETIKKWLGQITYTLTGSSGTFDFNYGFVKYEDFGNRNFTITDFEAIGAARANETGLNIELLHHKPSAFIYSAAAFIPNQTALISLATDYGTNNDVANGEGFAYKRFRLSTIVAGDNGEGMIIRVTTVVNNSINDASFHIGVILK